MQVLPFIARVAAADCSASPLRRSPAHSMAANAQFMLQVVRSALHEDAGQHGDVTTAAWWEVL
jgi:hypothetical protein